MRLIDADALPKYTGYALSADEVAMAVENAPTIDAVPVRHGHWEVWFENEEIRQVKCSECRMVFNVGKGRDGNYCPNCGAKMDKEEDDETDTSY